MIALTTDDRQQINRIGITEQQIEQQIEQFKKGFGYSKLIAAATPGKGIVRFTEQEIESLVNQFDEDKEYYDIIKFVPASGAASRMFKSLYAFIDEFKDKDIPLNFLKKEKIKPNSVENFFLSIRSFAFFEDLKKDLAKKGKDIEEMLKNNELVEIAEDLLDPEGLSYGKLPKALLKFHNYENYSRYAIEEHLVEAAQYSTITSEKGVIAQIHFTVSKEHLALLQSTIDKLLPKYEKMFNVKYKITYSEQKPSTDTIAVDLNNEPFREKNGSLVFRPGGHGALIQNLNDLRKEIIFIKNIDNVVPDRLKDETIKYKKVLGGYLFHLQQQLFEYLVMLDEGSLENEDIEKIAKFANDTLMIEIPEYFETYNEIEKIDFLYNKLNRPIRICGMVRNEGEPGGGPYFVKNQKDETSLQIVEYSQMNLSDEKQKEILQNATHFNPVDLVCGTQNFKGNSFDLNEYIDHNTGFISQKSKDGKELKALELPGLWNGAMADWITIFVDVPIITFNPVKEVNDLLRETHQ